VRETLYYYADVLPRGRQPCRLHRDDGCPPLTATLGRAERRRTKRQRACTSGASTPRSIPTSARINREPRLLSGAVRRTIPTNPQARHAMVPPAPRSLSWSWTAPPHDLDDGNRGGHELLPEQVLWEPPIPSLSHHGLPRGRTRSTTGLLNTSSSAASINFPDLHRNLFEPDSTAATLTISGGYVTAPSRQSAVTILSSSSRTPTRPRRTRPRRRRALATAN
jgi:hypothetical protein